MAALAAIESRKPWPLLGMLRVAADKMPVEESQNVSRTQNCCATSPLPDSRRGKLKGGQEGVDVDISQFLELAGFLWGAVRVSNIQVEDQVLDLGWCPRCECLPQTADLTASALALAVL